MKDSIIEKYEVQTDELTATVNILHDAKEYVPIYHLIFPKIEPATEAVLDSIRERVIMTLTMKAEEILNPEDMTQLKERFVKRASKLIDEELPNLPEKDKKNLIGTLIHESLGLGPIEIMLQDKNLEEIVVNSSKDPIWVYHIKFGWLKTNITIPTETKIYNYASQIGRRVGTQITNLNPLMDAYLTTGDRANATLFPISSEGNTLTIRKFARRPWTITDFIEDKSLSADLAAFLWLAIEYELNILVAGGTASGKTSMLNVLSCFIPPTQRIISIEDTREIQLPEFLHWIPLTTRPPNLEGRGEVTMLQLMINALRMRPDRIIVGEMRRSKEAEVLFEAIHTGHSVYSTLHANTAEETFRRLVNPPIDIPKALLSSLQLIAVMHRDRRKNTRRLLEIAELIPATGLEEIRIELNTIFKWSPSSDKIVQWGKAHRVSKDIKLFSGMSDEEMQANLNDKKLILNWLVKKQVKDINKVGRIISDYYKEPEKIIKMAKKNENPY